MDWARDTSSGGLLVQDPTPDTLASRDEELAWCMQNRRPWRLVNGQLLTGKREALAEDLRQAMQLGRTEWKSRYRDLALSGVPLAAEGTYGALAAYPLPAALASVTLTASEALLIPSANLPIYLPIPQNGVLAPQAYRVIICGSYTTAATAGSLVMTARYGNATGSPALSNAATISGYTSSLTSAFWYVMGDITIQSIGAPGTNSKVIAQFNALCNTAVGGASSSTSFGITTPASVDTTVTASTNGGCITLNVNDSGATNHGGLVVAQIHWMDWN